jgi:ribosomal protein S26
MGMILDHETSKGVVIKVVECVACGRVTPLKSAHQIRRNEIRRYLETGER